MDEFDRVVNMDTLYRAWQKISLNNACPGIDCVDLSLYRSDLQKHLRMLHTAISCGKYTPYKEKTFIHKDRSIGVSSVDDKIVQTVLANAVKAARAPSSGVHGFINNRSIFTAKKTLDKAMRDGITVFSKIDIKRFYDSIDINILLGKLSHAFSDAKLMELIELLLDAHSPGLSTGSCLSPALSNYYLMDFDYYIHNNSVFYSRYVDDMLVAPVSINEVVGEKLSEVSLEINNAKSGAVDAAEGFRYLGFDIKSDIDKAIHNGNFSLAASIYEAQESDVAGTEQPEPIGDNTSNDNNEPKISTMDAPPGHATVAGEQQPSADILKSKAEEHTSYEMPNAIRNVIRKCHIVNEIVDKAQNKRYLALPDKQHLLQIFHCLGEDGARYIHHVLSNCNDYDYAETQSRINKYRINNPIGCKKLCERAGGAPRCACDFRDEKIYPTPIIHALRVDRNCFRPTNPSESIGHFKAKNPKDKAVDALSAMIDLNIKQYEISEQQKILKGQIDDLFERIGAQEFLTPQGMLVKGRDGIFLKIG